MILLRDAIALGIIYVTFGTVIAFVPRMVGVAIVGAFLASALLGAIS